MHQYTIMQPFTAVEATAPPSEVHGRDEPPEDWFFQEHPIRLNCRRQPKVRSFLQGLSLAPQSGNC